MKGVGDFMAGIPTWVFPILLKLMGLLTPQLRLLLKDFALGFYERAKETDNPFDDVAASLLLALLSIPTPKY